MTEAWGSRSQVESDSPSDLTRLTGAAGDAGAAAVTVVIATRDRRPELSRTLDRLTALPERPPVVVVDNASRDGTAAMVRERYPAVGLIRLPRNRGAAARNAGVRHATTRYVAFSDDDSWWAPGSLARAAAVLDGHPDLAVLAARLLVGPDARPDPIDSVLAASPLPRASLPGPRVLGFLACAAVVRREAFLAVGGFSPLLLIGGEEELLAADLAAAGWAAGYVPDVVAHHHPSTVRDTPRRRALLARNRVLVSWLRRPPRQALAATAELARQAARDRTARRAVGGLLARMPRAVAARRPLPPEVEGWVRLLADGGTAEPPARARSARVDLLGAEERGRVR